MADEVRRLQLVVPMVLRLEFDHLCACIHIGHGFVCMVHMHSRSVIQCGEFSVDLVAKPNPKVKDPKGGILELPLDPSGDVSDQDEGPDARPELS